MIGPDFSPGKAYNEIPCVPTCRQPLLPTRLHHPAAPLAPSALDEFLTAGWRPTGQSVYIADYLRTEDDALYGCLQLRVPLRGFRFKKRHRKLLRRNGQLFRTVVRPSAPPTPEMMNVNEKYRELHPEKSQDDLSFHVVGDRAHKVINTHEVLVYLRDKLIGFSYFDVGQHCLYSKAGIYDPAFGDFSLGTYTMLLELEWALEQGYHFYHPGYYAPAYPVFNYKLNLGPTQYLDPASGQWIDLTEEPIHHPADPYRRIEKKLTELVDTFSASGIQSRILEYPSFTARYFYANSDLNAEELLDGALLVQPYGPSVPDEQAIVYDLPSASYIAYETSWAGMQDFRLRPASPVNGRKRLNAPVAIHKTLAVAPTANELVARLKYGRRS